MVKLPLMKKYPGLKDFPDARQRRQFLEKKLATKLENIGHSVLNEDLLKGRNIENLIGATQIPLGVAGPLTIRSKANKLPNYYLPLATTEGALVASISRGCKAIYAAGGANLMCEVVGITRGPVFKTDGIEHGHQIKQWIDKNFLSLSKIARQTSKHLNLLKIDCQILGKNLFARFFFDSTDAMGMNMATIATEKAVSLIAKHTHSECTALAGNFDIDKKPAWLNFINGRGKKVWAEVILSPDIIKTVLKTTPQKIAEVVYRKNHLGSEMAGSLGFNAHFANVIAALFIATGQDPAHVVEGSLGITTAEVLENGDLYFAIYLPSLIVGTIGGGTQLPTQKEALAILGVANVLEYAQVAGAAVLAGELSLIASLAQGSLAKAHIELARRKRQA